MKTKNNVQKTILRSAAVIISFVLISYTVSAQDFWKKLLERSSFNEIALAMVEVSDNTKDVVPESMQFYNALLETANDPKLETEEWMGNESNFGMPAIQVTDEVESDLDLEGWMLNEELFRVDNNNESPLEVESWMTSEKVWEM
jgi:hypothetical protein